MTAGWQELTPREAEVLAAVERRLGNAEIAAEMVVSVRTVETHIAALRRKLGVGSRAALIEAARARRTTVLQLPQNSFVGRDDDTRAVAELLDDHRWVTVVGPAGCGKTRLALELAARGSRVPVVVELEHTAAPAVVPAVAKAVGLGVDSSSDVVAACGVALQAQPYLLVLDNADRVPDAVDDVVRRLLALAGSLRVLVTSQSPVGAADEVVYPLRPLSVDDGAGSAAVRLFLDRARGAAPGLESTSADVELAAAVCRRLDGLPLAIELAAARTRHLSLAELAGRLEAGFGALDRAGAATRHRTLDAAFSWSWELLDDEERAALCRLAALPRTFDLRLAEAVVPGAESVVLRLLDRSLLTPAPTATEPRRFRLLEPLRAFVLGRSDPADVEEVRRTHAAHHLELATAVRLRARTDDSRESAAEAARLCPEINAALRWTLPREPRTALELARALAVGGEQYGPDLDSLDSITAVARDPAVREVASAEELVDLGIALCYGDLELVADLAVLAFEKVHDDGSELAARHLAGYADAYRHRPQTALGHLEVAERLADRQVAMWRLASVRMARGIALRDLGEGAAALAAFERAMRTFALAGDAMHVNNARYMMAATAADVGRLTDEAIGWVEQCAAYATASGNRHELAHAVLTRARLVGRSDLDDDLHSAVVTFRAVGDLRCLARCHLLMAGGRPADERVELLEQALAVAASAHDVVNQERALEALVHTHWAAGDGRSAATAWGTLLGLVGRDRALALCPSAMAEQLDAWESAAAEGRARGRPRP